MFRRPMARGVPPRPVTTTTATTTTTTASTTPTPANAQKSSLRDDVVAGMGEVVECNQASHGASADAMASRSSPAPRQHSSAIRAARAARNGAHTAPLERTSRSEPSKP